MTRFWEPQVADRDQCHVGKSYTIYKIIIDIIYNIQLQEVSVKGIYTSDIIHPHQRRTSSSSSEVSPSKRNILRITSPMNKKMADDNTKLYKYPGLETGVEGTGFLPGLCVATPSISISGVWSTGGACKELLGALLPGRVA